MLSIAFFDSMIIITFGTFDFLHEGHVNIFKTAKTLGHTLIVGVSSDQLNFLKKQKKTTFGEGDRMDIVKKNKYVDKVFLEESLDKKKEYILQYNADILIMGDDHMNKYDDMLIGTGCKCVYVKRTENISSSKIQSLLDVKEKIILIDMDNTIVDWDKQFFKVFKYDNDKRKIDWDITKCYPDKVEDIQTVTSNAGFYSEMEPIAKSIESVRTLGEKHNVFFLTSPNYKNTFSYYEKAEWIKKYFGETWVKKLIICSDKTMVSGHFLIDDKPYKTCGNWVQIVYKQKYNNGFFTWDLVHLLF